MDDSDIERRQRKRVPPDLPPLTEDQMEMLRKLAEKPDSEIDLEDIPESTDEQLARATFYYSDAIRIKSTDVHLKMDNDNLEWLKSPGKGYQRRLNKVVRWARANGCPVNEL